VLRVIQTNVSFKVFGLASTASVSSLAQIEQTVVKFE